jgi:SagB-type dehydrogenase family enzyme
VAEPERGEPGAVARAFHQATKHSFASIRRRGHFLDWDNQPHPFKVYEGLPGASLPAESAAAAGEADLRALARMLRYGAGILRTRKLADGQDVRFRTYASAGALYPVELYVVSGDLAGMTAGVFHFDPAAASLTRLREGDHRPWLVRAAAGEPAVATAPVALVLTGIPWRTGWKYTERGYRHLYWDAGMILANLLALAQASALPARVILGFVDAELELLLGLDGVKEFPLCVMALGTGAPATADAAAPEPLSVQALPLSPREMVFEAITQANDAGRLATPAEVEAWRDAGLPSGSGPAVDELPDPIDTVIARRGSARFFDRSAMPAEVMSSVMDRAAQGVPTDYASEGSRLTKPYLIVNAVDDLARGAYAYRNGDFRPIKLGDFRRMAGYLCLEQRLAADAAAAIFLLSDLERILGALGDRGYRAAQLEAGIVGGKLYLGAYAHRFGASGLTFYDDDVTEFFSPDAEGKSCMLVVAVGGSPRLARAR